MERSRLADCLEGLWVKTASTNEQPKETRHLRKGNNGELSKRYLARVTKTEKRVPSDSPSPGRITRRSLM